MDAPARLPDADRAWAARLWSEAVRTQPACETVWLHGDVHPGNVLIWNARISGILDWALCGIGDGACDLRFRTARRLSPCAGGHRRRMAARRGGRCRWRSFICPTRMKMDYPVTCPRK
ncbi:phosphotransferase [Hyphomonas sp.]|uniref:phosphotransferase n=1 Tax=Hyphomonas sp. TaxID=87 RepID=UPI0033418F4E